MTKDQSPWCCINVSEELTHVEDSSLHCGEISNESKTGRIKWTLVSWLIYKKNLDVEEIAYWNLIGTTFGKSKSRYKCTSKDDSWLLKKKKMHYKSHRRKQT